MAYVTKSPKYENRKLVIDNTGNIVLEEPDIASEILERLISKRGTNPFRPTHGSNIFKSLNSRGIVSNQISIWAREALQPMIEQGRIDSTLVILPAIVQNKLLIDITVKNADGQLVTVKFFSYLLN